MQLHNAIGVHVFAMLKDATNRNYSYHLWVVGNDHAMVKDAETKHIAKCVSR
jgi:hypothetical protein